MKGKWHLFASIFQMVVGIIAAMSFKTGVDRKSRM